MAETTPPQPVYANVAEMIAGPFDLIIDFGFKPPESTKRGSTDHEIVARVAMSLSHAKSLIPILAKTIAQYESQVGPITTPGFDDMAKE
jgi:hypothetical protein